MLQTGAIDVKTIHDTETDSYLAYLKESGKPPIDYISGKFGRYDVVILGEDHQVQETCKFVADLMSPLYHKAGVRCLAMEIFKHRSTPQLNQLVTGDTYDEALALKLFRYEIAWPIWGYQEYMDILKAIWQVNRGLPPGGERFKVIGINDDSMDMHKLSCGSSMDSIRQRWKEGMCDRYMADVIQHEVLDNHQKALVLIGSRHTPVRYRYPAVIRGKMRWQVRPKFGSILYESSPMRIFQVVMDQKGYSDYLKKLGISAGGRPVGFDIEDSPLACLRDENNEYFRYQKNVTLSDIAQGYVWLKPREALHSCQWVDGFINEDNFEKANDLCLKIGLIPEKCKTPQALNEILKKAQQK